MPCGDPVHGVGIVRDRDFPIRQLLAKSYRARPGAQGGIGQRGDPLGELFGGEQERPPERLASG